MPFTWVLVYQHSIAPHITAQHVARADPLDVFFDCMSCTLLLGPFVSAQHSTA